MEKLRVFEAFAGYGSQHLALKRLKRDYPSFDFEVVGISEIDRYAIQAYQALHGETNNFGDISKIDWSNVPDFDLFTYSFPCTDISNAGQQKGFAEDSGTRSSLLWECRKAIVQKRPKYLLLENVKALVSKKFLHLFQKWLKDLEDYGYYTNWAVLNSKNYGIPQNRERVFAFSIRRDLLDPSPVYHFPKPFPLELRLKDVLEPKVDERYYLSDKMIKNILSDSGTFVHKEPHTPPYSGAASTLNARMAKMGRHDNYIKTVGKVNNSQDGTVCDTQGIAPTLTAGHGNCPKIITDDMLYITNIECVDYVAPNGCSGTGYSQFYKVDITYSDGVTTRINLDTWYRPIDFVIEDFISQLRDCKDIEKPKDAVDDLFIAMKEFGDCYMWNRYLEYVKSNKYQWETEK